MKKVLTIMLATIMIFSITAAVSAKEPFAKLDVPKCETAPVIDGVISKGEYKLIATYDATSPLWNRDSSGLDDYSPEAEVYATWDEDYFYLAVKIKNLDPQYTPGPNNWVFEQVSLMTAMVYDDPTLPVFASSDGSDWEWGDANAASFSREWTIGKLKDGTVMDTNHFGSMVGNANFKSATTHGDYDVYEQAIPWAGIAKEDGIEVGGMCGLAFTACVAPGEYVEEVYNGGYISLASGISGGKNFERYAQVKLTANESFEFEDVDVDPDPDSDPDPTPPTADSTIALIVISMIALVGAAFVTAKKSR